MNEIDVMNVFLEEGYQVSPEALKIIISSSSPSTLIKSILSTVDESVIVVEPEHIPKNVQTSETADFEGCPVRESILESAIESNPLPSPEVSSNPKIHYSEAPESENSFSESLYSETPSSKPSKATDPAPVQDSNPVTPYSNQASGFSKPAPNPDSLSSSFSSQPSPARPFTSPSPSTSPLSSVRSKGSSYGTVRNFPKGHSSGENPVTVLSDVTGQSNCVGEYMQFIHYFRDRYSKLSEILRGRLNARPIESLKGRGFRRGGDEKSDEISIIGMVSDISNTNNGHKILSLEDPTGSFSVLIRNNDKELFELASRVLLDEVIGATGSVTKDGNLMIAKKLTQPDAPNGGARRTGANGKAILISDVHVGSCQFLEDSWLDFLDFLQGESDSEAMREIAKEVRYLVIAGDLVDGVGIYPDQEKELSILDIYDQYKKAAEYLRKVPEHIHIILSPGNHDAVRQAEPQPALAEDIQAYFPSNVTFVGNPALVDMDGVQILIYHGRSIDDLVASVPGVSYQEPAGAMLEMIKRRHLAPTYGSRVSIAPEKRDYFVIDPVPDIIHTGHVHTVGIERYKNVLLVNSGTWQDQTEFQKRVNLMPMPAKVPVVDLADLGIALLDFS